MLSPFSIHPDSILNPCMSPWRTHAPIHNPLRIHVWVHSEYIYEFILNAFWIHAWVHSESTPNSHWLHVRIHYESLYESVLNLLRIQCMSFFGIMYEYILNPFSPSMNTCMNPFWMRSDLIREISLQRETWRYELVLWDSRNTNGAVSSQHEFVPLECRSRSTNW